MKPCCDSILSVPERGTLSPLLDRETLHTGSYHTPGGGGGVPCLFALKGVSHPEGKALFERCMNFTPTARSARPKKDQNNLQESKYQL